MRDDFGPYEDAFAAWVRDEWPGAADGTREYLGFLSDPDDPRRAREGALWPHQWEALQRVAYAHEMAGGRFARGQLLDIATGGGKTAVIAACMAWLRLAHGVQRFLILCPNLIVRDRLESDFRGGRVFAERGLLPPGALRADDFGLTVLGGRDGEPAQALIGARAVLSNIHRFHADRQAGREALEALLGRDPRPFAIFNDEAHNTPAPEYAKTLRELAAHPAFRFRLDTTATPDRLDDAPLGSRLVYRFGIPEARAARVVAETDVYQPVIGAADLTYTDKATGEQRTARDIDWREAAAIRGISAVQWVTDPEPKRQQLEIALQRLGEAAGRARGRWKPVLFVVSASRADARDTQEMLRERFGRGSLLVIGDEDGDQEEMRAQAAAIGDPDGEHDIAISVQMLREGWDVPEVGVILLLRKIASGIYGPQIVGRGMRRVRREGVPEGEDQRCAVVDHPALDHQWLWDQLSARVFRQSAQGELSEIAPAGDLPPAEPDLARPELLIEVPEPDPEADPFPPPGEIGGEGEEAAADWRRILDLAAFGDETVTISGVTIDAVEKRTLGGEWIERLAPPRAPGAEDAPPDPAERLRSGVAGIAQDAVRAAGYADHLAAEAYGRLLDFVIERWLGGKATGFADPADTAAALRRLGGLRALMLERGEIVRGMLAPERGDGEPA